MKILKIIFLISFTWGSGTGKAQQSGFYQEIPYETINNKIIILADVEGIEGKYLFDTGAPVCLTHTRMKKGPEKESVAQRVKDAHNNETIYRLISLKSVKLGDIDFGEIPALVFDEGNPLEYFGIDGIIGSSLFPNVVVRIDPRRKILTLASDTSRMELNPQYATDMETDQQNIPYVIIDLKNGMGEEVMFDTGSSRFYEINEPIYHQLATTPGIVTLSKGFGASAMGIGGMEKKTAKWRVRIDNLELGAGKFRNVITETVDAVSSRIGTGLLDYGSVTLDFPGKTFYFSPDDTLPVDLNRRNWNVEIVVSGDSLIAGCVWQSMADQLQTGERVVAINGKRYNKINTGEALTTPLIRLEGEEAVITVIDQKGREKTLTIRKE